MPCYLGNKNTHSNILLFFMNKKNIIGTNFVMFVKRKKIMKKLLTIIALFAAFKATAQLGFKSFASTSWAGIRSQSVPVGQKQLVDGRMHFSYSAGLSYDFKIKGKVYFAPELLFSSIKLSTETYIKLPGGNYGVVFEGVTNTYNIIESPLLIKVKGKQFYSMVGVNAMLPLVGKLDLYTNVAIGVKVIKNLNIEARYNHGLLKYNAEGYHNNRLSIGLGYIIHN